MLIKRWCCLLSIAAATFIIYISPAVAAFKQNNSGSFTNITIAELPTSIKQQQASTVLQQLDLTTEQQEQIKKIHYKYKQQIQKKSNSLAVLQRQLSDLMVSTKPTHLIRAKNQQLVNLRREIGQLRFESMLATREILTPEQRQKFRDIIDSQLAP